MKVFHKTISEKQQIAADAKVKDLTRKTALVLAFLSVFFFFFKLLFF